jgi:hypothetical protein
VNTDSATQPTAPELTAGPAAVSYHRRIAAWFIAFGACMAVGAVVLEIVEIPLAYEIGALIALIGLFALTRGIKSLGRYHQANGREVAAGYTTVRGRKTIRANKQKCATAQLWVLAPETGAVLRKPMTDRNDAQPHVSQSGVQTPE